MPWIEGFKLKTRWISFKKQKWCPTMQAPQPHAAGALWKHLPFLSTRNVLSVKLKGSFQDPNFTIPSPTVPPTDSCITTQRIAVSQAGLRMFYITSVHVAPTGYVATQRCRFLTFQAPDTFRRSKFISLQGKNKGSKSWNLFLNLKTISAALLI